MPSVDLSRARWRKSSHSGGNNGQCVEVATNMPGLALVRDSKDPDGPALSVTPTAFRAFVAAVKAGRVTTA